MVTFERVKSRYEARQEAERKRQQALLEQHRKVKVSQSQTETYEVTSYTAYEESTSKSPGHPAFGITASGRKVQAGVTAACPRELPFGTRLRIENVGVRVCYDRGGAIKNKKLDVYIPNLTEARKFGRKRLKVEIIKKGGN